MARRYRFGPFRLDAHTGHLERDGAPVDVQPAALHLLAYFLDHRGELLSRERLLKDLWDATVVDDALTQMLTRLRRTLGDSPRDPAYIETVPKRGYRFVATVEVDEDDPAPSGGGVPVAPSDGFVGREDALRRLAQGDPLTTICGPGGVGKSRLVREHLRTVPHRVTWSCDVQDAVDAKGVGVAAALALGLGQADIDPIGQVGRALAARAGVLVLENVERATDGVRSALEAWVPAAPRVRFLVASRERLNLPDEVVVDVEPLPPDQAAALFRICAGTVGDGLDAAESSDHIDAIVLAVDGLPLGVEIAAARLRLFSLAALRERLASPLSVLSDRRRIPRHASLSATIGWSWDLLPTHERSAAEQLSVFRTDFTAGEAECVVSLPGAAPGGVLDVLDALLDKSLLRRLPAGPADAEARFGMLSPIRSFAEERRAAEGDVGAATRHARLFAGHGSAEGVARLDRDPAALRRLTQRPADVSAALDHAVSSGEAGLAVELFVLTAYLVDLNGPVGHAADRAPAVLALPDLGALGAARVRVAAAADLRGRNDRAGALALLEQGRTAASAGAPEYTPTIEGALARLSLQQSRHEEADAHAAAALTSDPDGPWQDARGDWLAVRASAAQVRGDLVQAHAWSSSALAWTRLRGNRRAEAVAMANLANVAASRGDLGESLHLLERSVALHQALGNARNEAMTQLHVADVLAAANRHDEAMPIVLHVVPRLRAMGERHFLAVALFLLGVLANRGGDQEQALVAYEEARSLAVAGQNRWLEAAATGGIGEVLVARGFEDGLLLFDRAEATLRELDQRLPLGALLVSRAQAEHSLGRREQALARLDDAELVATETGERGLVVEIGQLRRAWIGELSG